jgi:hypothetical protein
MVQNEANVPTNFEVPAPVCVCGLLVVAALTKVGHPHWAIGGMISVYVLYLAMQYAKHSAGYAHALGVADSIMMHVIHCRSDYGGHDCSSDSGDVRSCRRVGLAYSSKAENRSSPSSANSPGQPLIRNVTNPDRTLPA